VIQAIRLSDLIRTGWANQYPEPVARAIYVAFAVHFRTLQDFFHDGHPKNWTLLPPESRSDLTFSDVLQQFSAGTRNPYAKKWSLPALRRVRDADKLMGHLSKQRRARTRRREWGSEGDWELLVPMLQRLIPVLPGRRRYFRDIVEAARDVGLVQGQAAARRGV